MQVRPVVDTTFNGSGIPSSQNSQVSKIAVLLPVVLESIGSVSFAAMTSTGAVLLVEEVSLPPVGVKTVTLGSEKSPNSTPLRYSTLPPLEDNTFTSSVDANAPEKTDDEISFVVLENTSLATVSAFVQSGELQSVRTTISYSINEPTCNRRRIKRRRDSNESTATPLIEIMST